MARIMTYRSNHGTISLLTSLASSKVTWSSTLLGGELRVGWRICKKHGTTWTNLLSCMTKINKIDLLQSRLNELLKEDVRIETWWIEYRPFSGWYSVCDYPRFSGDDGVFLGKNYQEAFKNMEVLFA